LDSGRRTLKEEIGQRAAKAAACGQGDDELVEDAR
jgi:hypothetical protein